MKRREFFTLLGGAAATWSFAARGQQPAMPVIGFLGAQSPQTWAGFDAAFRQGLNEAGFVVGRNVTMEYRWADGRLERLRALASELVDRRVALIFASGGREPAVVAKAVTTTIPIVFAFGGDPVGVGLVASANRPGGNVTGTSSSNVELVAKRVGLLHELIPTGRAFAILVTRTVRLLRRMSPWLRRRRIYSAENLMSSASKMRATWPVSSRPSDTALSARSCSAPIRSSRINLIELSR